MGTPTFPILWLASVDTMLQTSTQYSWWSDGGRTPKAHFNIPMMALHASPSRSHEAPGQAGGQWEKHWAQTYGAWWAPASLGFLNDDSLLLHWLQGQGRLWVIKSVEESLHTTPRGGPDASSRFPASRCQPV